MNTPLQIDSNWRHSLIKGLSQHIFSAELRRLAHREHDFVRENSRLGGSIDGFLYQGHFFSDLDPTIRSKGEKGSLHPSLISSVELHMSDRKNTLFERSRVEQALALLLQNCYGPQDIYDALPNALHETFRYLFPQAKGLSRSRKEAWSIEGNDRALRQYDKLREKIEFYSVSRLLY